MIKSLYRDHRLLTLISFSYCGTGIMCLLSSVSTVALNRHKCGIIILIHRLGTRSLSSWKHATVLITVINNNYFNRRTLQLENVSVSKIWTVSVFRTPQTQSGLSYRPRCYCCVVSDLISTCMSEHNRDLFLSTNVSNVWRDSWYRLLRKQIYSY